MRRSLGFGFGPFGRTFFGALFDSLNRDDPLRSGGTESLGDGLLATAPASATSTTTATSASTLAFSASACLAGLLGGVRGLFGSGLRFKLRLGGGGNFGLVMARLKMAGLADCAGSLLRIEICRLQWRRRRLTSRLRDFLLTAL
jgi:hypothetical protein